MAISKFSAKSLLPPHKVTRPEQVRQLAASMIAGGWQGPPLIGYWLDGKVQLLSGTHRRAAARLAHIPVPVDLKPFEDVKAAWGDVNKWLKLMTS